MTSIERPAPTGVTPTGLVLPDGLDLDEWVEAGKPIVRTHASSMWWIGDWVLYAEQHFADDPTVTKRIAKVVEGSGMEPTTARVAKWVAGVFSPQQRRERLSWSHHRVVGNLSLDQRDSLLDDAEALGLSVAEVRRSVIRITAVEAPSEESAERATPAPSCLTDCDQPALDGAPVPICETHATALVGWWEQRDA